MIDLEFIRQAYEMRDNSDTLCVWSKDSLADDLARHDRQFEILNNIMPNIHLQPLAQSSVHRDSKTVQTTN